MNLIFSNTTRRPLNPGKIKGKRHFNNLKNQEEPRLVGGRWSSLALIDANPRISDQLSSIALTDANPRIGDKLSSIALTDLDLRRRGKHR